ncbi:T9SS type A sorting domain-containing protein [Polaribacter sp. Q13]|uniref:T9SS type A sorting domain-containing protein n=1 Tax=Polaribacter sp. Q13 TaxID=2806551 RepID=UPI00193C44D8|nr:T9SS type A sorting domain-containing protein [Polaribacter sp. Q13]QVY66612.1 T9SS type A sorting domain-containing protein [Polaribacter sp. Q13]
MSKFIFVVIMFSYFFVYSQSEITIDHKTQRFINGVSEFNRNKFITGHFLYNSNDTDFESFKNEYNIDSDYKGSRQFWNPFGKVKNGVIPNVQNKYSGIRNVEPLLVATGTAGQLFYDDSKDYSIEDVSVFSKNVANYVANSYKKDWALVPEFIEPFNEPMVHAVDYYPEGKDGKYITSKIDNVITKMCQYLKDLGQSIHAVPELQNMKVVGYASAYPEFENNDFDLWNKRFKKFIDIAGNDVDVFSVHLYDGSGLNNSGGRRSGANSEAILDLIETYSSIKLQTVKPIAVTEYGRLVANQPGFPSVSNYEPITNSQAVRSQMHLVMNFIERGNDMLVAIPFNVNTRNRNSQYSKSSVWIKDENGKVELTQRKLFYEIWKDVKGKRVFTKSNNLDVQTQAFVDDNKVHVVLNNLNDAVQTVDLNLLNKEGLQNVDIKRVNIFLDKLPEITETSQNTAPETLSLNYGETVVLTYKFNSVIAFNNTIDSKKYYATEYLKTINANTNNTFTFNNVATGNGLATLRLSIGRAHNLSLKPTLFINGNEINTDGDIIRGYNQSTRKQFFGTLEIPVEIGQLKQGTNTLTVKFADNGGRISSAILQVQQSQNPLSLASNIQQKNKFRLVPNYAKKGDLVTLNSSIENEEFTIYTLSGVRIYKGTENKIDTSKLNSGMYIVKTTKENLTEKLLIY